MLWYKRIDVYLKICMIITYTGILQQMLMQVVVRDGPLNFKGGGGLWFFFYKNILIPNVAEKKYSNFGGGKKKRMIQSLCHI